MQAGQPELRVYEVPTGELVPYAGNAKEHPDWQVGQIVASIERFGFLDPVGVWHDPDGRPVIVEGHGRVMAAKELGMESVPCVALDHLDDEGRRAYALAHNQLTMNSGWDDLALSDELADLADMDMGDFGFDVGGDVADAADVAEVEVPEDVPTVCERGQVWRLGRHRLMCGDSTDADNVSRLMDGKRAEAAFTSPPYGVGLGYNQYDDSFENTKNIVSTVLPIICRFVDDYIILNWGDIVSAREVNGTSQPSQYTWLPLYDQLMRSNNWYIWAERIWKKPHAKVGGVWSASSNRPVNDWEYIFTWAKGVPAYNERNNGSHFGIIDSSESSENGVKENHPAAFPVYVAAKVVEIHTRTGAVVLDVFGGTGTTLIAAEQLNRTCYMMELDPHYCDVIIARWEELTGGKAERAE